METLSIKKKPEQREYYGAEKGYLVALASCIRHTEPGSAKHEELLWLVKHRATILAHRELIERMGKQTEP